jgi:hypothetical protein
MTVKKQLQRDANGTNVQEQQEPTKKSRHQYYSWLQTDNDGIIKHFHHTRTKKNVFHSCYYLEEKTHATGSRVCEPS